MYSFLPFTFVPVLLGFSISLAFANPAMLPKHPGHPMSDLRDPVNNMPLANDPARDVWTGAAALERASVSHDESSIQELPSDPTLIHEGAGTLPQVKGYLDIKIDPPVKEATDPTK